MTRMVCVKRVNHNHAVCLGGDWIETSDPDEEDWAVDDHPVARAREGVIRAAGGQKMYGLTRLLIALLLSRLSAVVYKHWRQDFSE